MLEQTCCCSVFVFFLRTSKIPARIMQISERFSSCLPGDHDGNLKIRATLRQHRNDSVNRSSANAPRSSIAPTLKWHPHVIAPLFSRNLCFFKNILASFLSGVCLPACLRSARQHLSTEASGVTTERIYNDSVYRATNCILTKLQLL